jgi:hypothetical protein
MTADRKKMTQRIETITLIEAADALLCKAMRSNGGKHRNALAAEHIVDAQAQLLDAITHLQTN